MVEVFYQTDGNNLYTLSFLFATWQRWQILCNIQHGIQPEKRIILYRMSCDPLRNSRADYRLIQPKTGISTLSTIRSTDEPHEKFMV